MTAMRAMRMRQGEARVLRAYLGVVVNQLIAEGRLRESRGDHQTARLLLTDAENLIAFVEEMESSVLRTSSHLFDRAETPETEQAG